MEPAEQQISNNMGYTKLFSELIGSTIWLEDDKIRIVWITMLAIKNERHVVEASIPGLASFARVSVEDCIRALEKLKAPDKHSRSQEFNGRRIEDVRGGWRILNGEYYRQKLSYEHRKEYEREYKKEYRKRKKQLNNDASKDGAMQVVNEGLDTI